MWLVCRDCCCCCCHCTFNGKLLSMWDYFQSALSMLFGLGCRFQQTFTNLIRFNCIYILQNKRNSNIHRRWPCVCVRASLKLSVDLMKQSWPNWIYLQLIKIILLFSQSEVRQKKKRIARNVKSRKKNVHFGTRRGRASPRHRHPPSTIAHMVWEQKQNATFQQFINYVKRTQSFLLLLLVVSWFGRAWQA